MEIRFELSRRIWMMEDAEGVRGCVIGFQVLRDPIAGVVAKVYSGTVLTKNL
jgi:hypothetical protein